MRGDGPGEKIGSVEDGPFPPHASLEGKDEGANQRRNHADMVPADRRLIEFVRADE